MTDQPRDAAADLAVCEAATPDGFELGAIMNPDPEPGEGDFWHARTKFHRTVSKETAERYLRWCLLARYALPHWIHRAQAAEQRLAAVDMELAALRMVHTEARELVGEADAVGVIPQANLDALRCLLHRASQRRATP